MHVSNLSQNNLGANGIVGGGIPIATGAAMGIKQKGTSQVVLCFFSDGAANNGVFHESLNMASIFHLPVIYILENNHYAVSTPVDYSSATENLSVRASVYNMPGSTVNGNDAIEVYDTISASILHARKGEGPSLIECLTYRHGGHHVNDPGLYMPEDVLKEWMARDPIKLLQEHLLNYGVDQSEIDEINSQVEHEIETAIEFALDSPEPSLEDFLTEVSHM